MADTKAGLILLSTIRFSTHKAKTQAATSHIGSLVSQIQRSVIFTLDCFAFLESKSVCVCVMLSLK